MSLYERLLKPASRSLSGHLGRLGANLSAVAGELRQSVSTAVGRAAADAVRQAVARLMRHQQEEAGDASLDEPLTHWRRSSQQRRPGWDDPDHLGGWAEPDEPRWRQSIRRCEPEDDDYPDERQTQEQPRNSTDCWRSALGALCRLASCLLVRLASPGARILALGAGLATALAVWLGGPATNSGTLTDAIAAGASALAGLAGV
jgi:hypothetical protein